MPDKGAKGSSTNQRALSRRGSHIPLQYASVEALQCLGHQRLSNRASSPQYTIPASGASEPAVRRRQSQHDVPIQYAPEKATRSAGKQRLSNHPTSPMFSFFGAHGPEFTVKKETKKEAIKEEIPPIAATGVGSPVSDAFSSRHRRPQVWKWREGTCLSPAEVEKKVKFLAPRIKPGFEYNKANYQGKFEGKLHFAASRAERFDPPPGSSEQRPVTPGPGAYVYDVRVPSRGTRRIPVPFSTLGRSRLESQYPSAPTPTFPPPGFHPKLKPKDPTIVTQHRDYRDHPDRWTKSVRTAWSEGHDAYDENFWGY